MLKKWKSLLLLTFLVCFLCACGQQKDLKENGSRDGEERWVIMEQMEIPNDIDSRYVLYKQSSLFYLNSDIGGYTLMIRPYESKHKEIVGKLQYPMVEEGANYYLWRTYSGNPKSDDFLALWRVYSGTEYFYELVKYDTQGNELEIINLNTLGMQEYVADAIDMVEKDGIYYFLTNKMLVVFTAQGILKKNELGSERYEICATQEKVFFIKRFDSKITIHQISNGMISDIIFETSFSGNLTFVGDENEIFVSTGIELYKYDIGNNNADTVLNWTDVGLSGPDIYQIIGISKDTITIQGYDNNAFVIWTMRLTDVVDERTIITLSTLNINDSWLQDRVRGFNESNKEYRVIIKSPMDGAGFYSDEDAQMKQQLWLTSANPPDLIDLAFVENWTSYAKNGVFEDLSPYLEASGALQESDYLPNIMAAGKLDDAQIFIPYSFDFTMLYGLEKYLGSDPGWTLQEMVKLCNDHKDISVINADPSKCMRYLMTFGMREFVDFSEFKCDFESQLFYDLLQIAAKAGRTKSGYEYFYDDIVEERALFRETAIVNIEFYLGFTGTVPAGDLDGDVELTLKGYPSEDGQATGRASLPNSTYFAICSGSANKQGAWQFIEYLQTYKDPFHGEFPARKDWLLERISVVSPQSFSNVTLRDCTEDDIETLLFLIDNVKFQTNQDETILQIITEEAQAYFDGQKTEEEVAEIIQNRVQLYLSE
ncbi:MAG: extracellular solute-binding protein [Acetatifactor sp.]|nr:extracellular solute-binding protein [Acetatifactor sp.]